MIQQYTTQTGTVQWRVRVYARSAKNRNLRITRQQGEIGTELQAKKLEHQLKRECERALQQKESKGTLFCDLVDSWYGHFEKIKVATGHRQKTTQDDYLGGIRKWFQEYWKCPAMDINAYVVAAVFERMKESGICFGHRKKLKQILKSIFDYGIQSGMLPMMQRSPTFEVMLKRDEEKKPEILTLDEIQRLIQKAYESNHEWRRIWAVALMTGMRSGELQALEWQDVDFENKLINVNKSYNCRARSYKSTKAGYWRQVPISKELEVILKDQLNETREMEFLFPRHWEWDRGLQARVLRRFCYIHGLPSVKFHTLRACFATQMLRSGVEAAKVMKVCGWKELKTMQHYVRLAGIEIQGVTEALKLFPEQKSEELARAGSSFFNPLKGVEPTMTSLNVSQV